MDAIREQLKSALSSLESNASLNGYLLVRRDGMLLLRYPDSQTSSDLPGFLASTLGTFETLSGKLGAGEAQHLVIETDTLKILLLGGSLAVLVCLLDKSANEEELLALAKGAEAKAEQILA